MKKEIKKITEYILTSDEIEIIINCLDYCIHRLSKHPESGIKANLQAVDKLRKELKN